MVNISKLPGPVQAIWNEVYQLVVKNLQADGVDLPIAKNRGRHAAAEHIGLYWSYDVELGRWVTVKKEGDEKGRHVWIEGGEMKTGPGGKVIGKEDKGSGVEEEGEDDENLLKLKAKLREAERERDEFYKKNPHANDISYITQPSQGNQAFERRRKKLLNERSLVESRVGTAEAAIRNYGKTKTAGATGKELWAKRAAADYMIGDKVEHQDFGGVLTIIKVNPKSLIVIEDKSGRETKMDKRLAVKIKKK